MYRVLLLSAFLLPVLAHGEDASFFIGSYHGWSRGCGGTLIVDSRHLSWHSEYLDCAANAYEVLNEHHEGNAHRIVYLLKKVRGNCKAEVIELTHSDRIEGYVAGWGATAYPTLRDYQRQRGDQMLYSCTLDKDFNPRNNPAPATEPGHERTPK